jgi:N-acylglucosamine-6-phosphate 2-epimerase
MNYTRSSLEILKAQIEGGLIVSCQAPADSPLAKPEIIAALAQAAEQNGAVAVRIDSPAHISAVRKAVQIPIIGIYKLVEPDSEVYITPTFRSAAEVAAAGASIIAVDATPRRRPGNETLSELCEKIKSELKLPVMADVATFEEGIHAGGVLGCTFVGTTLSGYTKETAHLLDAPDFELIERLARAIGAPVVAEGRIASPEDVRKAFDRGAFSVVVGNALTGIDNQIKKFAAAARPKYTKTIA